MDCCDCYGTVHSNILAIRSQKVHTYHDILGAHSNDSGLSCKRNPPTAKSSLHDIVAVVQLDAKNCLPVSS